MPRRKTLKREIVQLRETLLDLIGVFNSPQPDDALIAMAGVDLGRALLPLLSRVARRGPLGIGELAELSGRDYTTVSRQIAKLERMGLVDRQVNVEDARIKEAVITARGRVMMKALDRAREQTLASLFAEWNGRDVAQLARLLRKFADGALEHTRADHSSG